MVAKDLCQGNLIIMPIKKAGRESLEKTKKIIRATITIEVPFDNELMNYGDKLNKKLKQVIADTDYISHETQAGELEPCTRPVIRSYDA